MDVEKEIAALKGEVETLKNSNKELDGKLKKVTADTNANTKALAGLGEQLKTAVASGDNAEQAKPEKPSIPEKPFTVNDRKFRFTAPRFFWKGETYTAAAAMEDAELLKDIVAVTGEDADVQGAGIIQSVK